MKTPEIMTVADLAEYLRCSPTTIYRMLRNQSVPAFKMGSDWRFNRSSIDQWLRMRGGQAISPGGRERSRTNEERMKRLAGEIAAPIIHRIGAAIDELS